MEKKQKKHSIFSEIIQDSEFTIKQSPITVGRNESASIRIKNPALSRIHCKY